MDNEEYIWTLLMYIEPVKAISIDTGKYLNKVFVITGTMSKPRSEIETYLVSEGAKIAKSLTSKMIMLYHLIQQVLNIKMLSS